MAETEIKKINGRKIADIDTRAELDVVKADVKALKDMNHKHPTKLSEFENDIYGPENKIPNEYLDVKVPTKLSDFENDLEMASSWNDLEDKPFGTFRGVIAEGHDVPAMMIGMVSEFPMLSFDKTYTFNFNGVDYQGVLKILPDMTPVEGSTMGCYIGNITLLTGAMGGMADSLLGDAADDIVDTGEPFFIMDMGDNMAIACWAANELNMTISDGENIVVENVSAMAMMEGAACIVPVNYPISEGGLYEITIDDMNVIGECKNRNGTLYVGNVFLSTGKEEENTGESFYFEYNDEMEPTTGIRVQILRGIFPEGKIISIVKFIGDYNKQIDSKYLDLSSKPGELGTGIYSEIFNDYTGNIASGEYSHAEGSGTDALGDYSHAEGFGSIASGEYSHAEGYATKATGSRSHAEGSMTLASGRMAAHAEGHSTVASAYASHSEGQATWASGEESHAEGTWTVAAGIASHAEGVGYVGNSSRYIKISAEANSTTLTINDDLDASYKHLLIHSEIGNSNITDCKVVDGKVVEITVDNPLSTKTLTNSIERLSLKNIATGEASHVEGKRTLALSDYQHVQGKYNALDTDDKYAHIVGNGTNDDNRSNAHTLDWEGNAEFQGDVIAYGCESGEEPISLKATYELAANAGGTFVVNINEGSGTGEPESLDKTYVEIKEAYDKGQNIICVGNVTGAIYTLQSISSGGVLFAANRMGGWVGSTEMLVYGYMGITTNDELMYMEDQLVKVEVLQQALEMVQLKQDNNLTTTSKEIVGAINELKTQFNSLVNGNEVEY